MDHVILSAVRSHCLTPQLLSIEIRIKHPPLIMTSKALHDLVHGFSPHPYAAPPCFAGVAFPTDYTPGVFSVHSEVPGTL